MHRPADVEPDPAAGQGFDDVAVIGHRSSGTGHRAGEPVQLGHHQVSRARQAASASQPRAGAVGPGHAVVDLDPFGVDAEGRQRLPLRR